jgi:hypothetical protein
MLMIVALIGLGAAGAGAYFYNKATAIDRSDPAVTVQQLLTAIFVEKDPTRVGLFVCPSLSPQAAMNTAAAAVDATAAPGWDTVRVEQAGDGQSTVTARMTFKYPGEVAPSSSTVWRFDLVDSDGWRVCTLRTAG